MNFFLEQSIAYAQQRSYLDDLFNVYPTIPNGIRDIDKDLWYKVEKAYNGKSDKALINSLLDLEIFPIKDSYVAYLKRDKDAINRNPQTIKRLAAEVREMNLTELFQKCSQPKETNRQIGPMFKYWVEHKRFGFPKMDVEEFSRTRKDAILCASDSEMKDFASNHLGYSHEKGLDFIARISGQYIIGEAKFLTDFGGHQNAQFNDAIATIKSRAKAIKVAILDGVLYIEGNNKMYKDITTTYKDKNIMSALLLPTFLNYVK